MVRDKEKGEYADLHSLMVLISSTARDTEGIINVRYFSELTRWGTVAPIRGHYRSQFAGKTTIEWRKGQGAARVVRTRTHLSHGRPCHFLKFS